MSFIQINVSHSFNKKTSDAHKERVIGGIIGSDSTLNRNLGNNAEINSINATSLTNSAVSSQSAFILRGVKRKTLIREIFVGAMGSVIGSIITFIIMNFLR